MDSAAIIDTFTPLSRSANVQYVCKDQMKLSYEGAVRSCWF
jgi:hypothetical protein